jgi:hypothetical protein
MPDLNPAQFGEEDPRRYGIKPPADVHPADEYGLESLGYRRVDLAKADFVASEPHLDSGYIRQLVRRPATPGRGGDKMAIEHQGQLHLWDGNHRTAAALERGQKHAYYDLYRTK